MAERSLLEPLEAEFHKTKNTCERTFVQLDDAALHAQINPLQNSIAVIIQHLAGNMESRWADFLTSDGEKPSRNREGEFAERNLGRAELMAVWERGWKCLFDSVGGLTDDDLSRVVTIRNEPHTVLQAIARQMTHHSWHAGQVALIAKHLLGGRWKYLTIPPGGSAAFNKKMGG